MSGVTTELGLLSRKQLGLDRITPLATSHRAGQEVHNVPAGLEVQTPLARRDAHLPGVMGGPVMVTQTPSTAQPEISGQPD